MKNNGNVGVINEQGFVAGNGLGFSPVNEEEFNNKITDNNSYKNNLKNNDIDH